MQIHPKLATWFFLGEILTTLPAANPHPLIAEHAVWAIAEILIRSPKTVRRTRRKILQSADH